MKSKNLALLFAAAGMMVMGASCSDVSKPVIPPGIPPSPIACTMEAKLCPDGSAVGRTGPNCEFAPCPGMTPTPVPTLVPVPTPVSGTCGPNLGTCSAGYRCIQKCGPPVARDGDLPPDYYCETNAIADKPRMCPICLASNTRIETPSGKVNVKDIKVGMQVWSVDKIGQKVASTVLKVGSTNVSYTHHVVHLVLSDAREVWVSPNHPTSDGRRIGDLKAGDRYDGATVRAADLTRYWDTKTFDILPDSETGYYWANSIMLGSTLR